MPLFCICFEHEIPIKMYSEVPFGWGGDGEVINSIDVLLQQLLTFANIQVFLNNLPVSYKLTVGQQKWTVCVLMVAKRLILQNWKTMCSLPISQWIQDLLTLLTVG